MQTLGLKKNNHMDMVSLQELVFLETPEYQDDKDIVPQKYLFG